MTFLPSCREVQIELTEYAEDALPRSRRIGIWIHLLLCRACAGVLRGLKALPGIAKAVLAAPKETPEVATTTLTQIQAALRKERP